MRRGLMREFDCHNCKHKYKNYSYEEPCVTCIRKLTIGSHEAPPCWEKIPLTLDEILGLRKEKLDEESLF